MKEFAQLGITPAQILLPKADCALDKWSVVACDQFTSQPQYWEGVEAEVAQSPSTLRIIYPECYLSEGESRIPGIHSAMQTYAASVLEPACEGFVLVERKTTTGARLGVVLAVDLEAYDYSPASQSLIRATEQTIEDRLPPRVKIRQGAPLESPHIMLLIDDPQRTVIEPLHQSRRQLRSLYGFELMRSGGQIRGWAVEGDAQEFVQRALSDLYDECGGLLFAVGDGNHSLATARQCWLQLKDTLSEAQRQSHPARYALVEVCNLHDPALRFEPIHRAIFGADSAQLSHDFLLWCRGKGMTLAASSEADADLYLLDAPVALVNAVNPLAVAVLQPFLDEWLHSHPEASIDYIHGDDVLLSLQEKGACGIRLRALDKNALFASVRKGGPLPRKTFSMGEARDKRYYLECRSLTE